MPSVQQWMATGVVCGAILALAGVVGLGWKLLRRGWRLANLAERTSDFLDQALGEPPSGRGDPGRPSLMERVGAIEDAMTAHMEWHADPGGVPARRRPPQPNGTDGRRRRSG